MKRHLTIAALTAAFLVALAPGTAVGQQDDDDAGNVIDPTVYLGVEDVAGVRCVPEIVTDNQPVTCIVDLTPDGPHEPAPFGDGPAIIAREPGRLAQSAECLPDHPDRLVCTGLQLFAAGERSLSFRPNSAANALDDVAAVNVVRDVEQEFHVSLRTREGALLRGGRPLVFDILEGANFAELDPARGVYAAVRPFDDAATLTASAVLKEPGSAAAPALSFDAPTGLYLATICIGDDAETCAAQPGAFPVRMYGRSVRPLVPGTTIAGADRINLVFAPSSLGSSAVDVITELLMLDGLPRALDADGNVAILDGTDEVSVTSVRFGMFAMEPFRSDAHRFNLWLYEGDVYQPFEAFFRAVSAPDTGVIDAFDLSDAALMVVADEAGRRQGERSEAQDLPWTASPEGTTRDELVFGASWTWVNSNAARLDGSQVMTHEFAHSLFNLRDEYVDELRPVRFGYPNCAPDQATAEEWWGDLVGELDPFYTEWVGVLAATGNDPFGIDAATLTTGFTPGGCYGTGDEAVRPTADSLMNRNIPVLGSVNRRHVESILDLFSGTKVIESTDIRSAVSTLSCTGGAVGAAVECVGSLSPGYDASAGLDMRVGDGAMGPCTIDGDAVAGQSLTCSAPPFGAAEQSVLLSVAGQGRFVPSGATWTPPPPIVRAAGLSEDLTRLEVTIVDLAGRPILDVEATINGEPAWIKSLSESATEIIGGVSPGDEVCVLVRGVPDSGSCVTAPPRDDAGSDPPADDDGQDAALGDDNPAEGGGIPLLVWLGVGLVAIVGAGFGIRAWWYRY